MTVKAVDSETPTSIICECCDEAIAPGTMALCFGCKEASLIKAENQGFDNGALTGRPNTKAIREWAQRRFVMGQISREVRDELEQCAADIEVGHG